jgi:hypothetical protein
MQLKQEIWFPLRTDRAASSPVFGSIMSSYKKCLWLRCALFADKHKGRSSAQRFAGRPPRLVNFVLLNWAMHTQLQQSVLFAFVRSGCNEWTSEGGSQPEWSPRIMCRERAPLFMDDLQEVSGHRVHGRDRKSVVWMHRMGALCRLTTCALSSLCQENPPRRPIFGQRVLGQIRRTTNHEKQAIGFSLLYDHPVCASCI